MKRVVRRAQKRRRTVSRMKSVRRDVSNCLVLPGIFAVFLGACGLGPRCQFYANFMLIVHSPISPKTVNPLNQGGVCLVPQTIPPVDVVVVNQAQVKWCNRSLIPCNLLLLLCSVPLRPSSEFAEHCLWDAWLGIIAGLGAVVASGIIRIVQSCNSSLPPTLY